MSIIQASSPVDGRVLGDFEVSDAQSILGKMATGRLAAGTWGNMSIEVRTKTLLPFSKLLLGNMDSICELIGLCTGKVRTEALLGEIYPLLDLLNYYQKHTKQILRYQGVPTSPFAFPGATAGIERRPYGVIAVISPWNYPFQLSIAPILTALFAGNAVILKVSELCLPVGQLIVDMFGQLDLPGGLVQCVVGDAQTGEQLIDAAPDLVFFIGGLHTGRLVMQRAARHPVPVILELGGKDPMLVFDDAQLDRASAAALYGAFCNSGQLCVSVERLYVQQNCYATFLDMLKTGMAQLKVGADPHCDLGAMTSAAQIDVVQAHYQDALDKGARASGPLERQGNFLKPVVLWNVHHGMRVMREESFGPLLPVMAFTDEPEALRLANDSEYGLNASIWSNNIDLATRVASQLNVGNWAINDVIKNIGHPGLPFGGVKQSGFGRYHGAEGLRNFTYPVSGLTNRSRLPKEPNWFPYSEQGYQNFKGYIDFVYGTGSFIQRFKRNRQALEAFREYSSFDLAQRWNNLKLMLSWKWDY
jgi:acyl-CoA reductase-like NAD-dependent aldehyde dehydrogenase